MSFTRFTQILSLGRLALFAALPLIACLPNHVSAAVYTVGASATLCNYTDLQSAIDGIPSSDHDVHIHVASDKDYSGVHITIDSMTLTLVGGYPDCMPASTPTPNIISNVSGSGHTGDSVIKFTGDTTATLQNLGIYLGSQGPDSHGGGINFTGHGYLTLLNTEVAYNQCGYGAGMNVSPDGPTVITIGNRTSFHDNMAAHSGGGIRVEGDTRLYITGGPVNISSNTAASGLGGGIDLLGPARVDIDSSGYIHDNTATYGGGISVSSNTGGDDALLRLYTSDPARPVQVSANRATENGGGIYLDGLNTGVVTARAHMCAYDFRIDGNFAKDGTAIYANEADFNTTSIGASVYLNQLSDPDAVCTDHEPLLSAVRCTAGTECNSISNGRSENEAQSLGGSAILIREAGKLLADNLQMRGNHGGYAIRTSTDRGVVSKIRNCLIVDNVASGGVAGLIKTDGNSPISFANCTFANNTIGGGFAFNVDDDFTLQRSIVNLQPGDTTFQETDSGSSIGITDVISNEIGSLSFNARAVTNPRFIDPAHGDYHLQAASAAVDATSTIDGLDLDGLPRGKDQALVKDFHSPTASPGDLGAYELQSIGNLVLNPGFDVDLRLWTESTPGIDQWQAGDFLYSNNYMRIYVLPATVGDHIGLKQCVHLPGPAEYELTGLARGGSFFGATNTPRLHWRFLAGTDDSCAGTPTASGDLYFPVTGFFTAPLDSAFVNVAPAQFGANSAIEITMIGNTDVAMTNQASVAGFDAISLTAASDEIFKNGFDGP